MTRTIRFFPDWGHRWPLWENGNDKYAMEPSDYGLSADLTNHLRSWWDDWNAHFSDESGWDSVSQAEQLKREASSLVEAIQAEVGDEFVVEDEVAAA